MFRRRKQSEVRSRARGRASTANVTVLGEGAALEGKLTVRGPLQIHGAVVGQLSCDGELDVGSAGRILGEVRATQLSVAGRVAGIVYSRNHLSVLATGQVRGHARYASLEVERGGIMEASTSLTVDYPDSDLDRDAVE